MKIGIRTPSLKKSFKARTTGKLKRSIKKAANPLYGKKGMGVINNPSKHVYNKVYNATTIGVNPLSSTSNSKRSSSTRTTTSKSGDTVASARPREKREFVWPKTKWDAIILGVVYVLALGYYLSEGTGFLLSLASAGLMAILFRVFIVWIGLKK